jgi:potassium-transporting ATPase KdpC subunit
MKNINLKQEVLISVRLVFVTMVLCCIVYPLVLLVFSHAAVPNKAEGSLIYNNNGEIVGSKLIGQLFTKPEYFWSRPSANGYDAANSCGSNLSPTNLKLRTRADSIIKRLGITQANVPSDMVTASGSGLDPHITIEAANLQVARVAQTRGLQPSQITNLIDSVSTLDGTIMYPKGIVNILKLNLTLDSRYGNHE